MKNVFLQGRKTPRNAEFLTFPMWRKAVTRFLIGKVGRFVVITQQSSSVILGKVCIQVKWSIILAFISGFCSMKWIGVFLLALPPLPSPPPFPGWDAIIKIVVVVHRGLPLWIRFVVPIYTSEASFSKAPETFRARKAIAKSGTLRLQSCFNHTFLIWTEFPFVQELSGAYILRF